MSETSTALHRSIIRLAGLLVAGVLCVLILTSVLPPLVADQSDRAVINAPVALVTSPIAGELDMASARIGQELTSGEVVAKVTNARVDRSTLITLESKVADDREKASATAKNRKADLAYVALLDAELSRQRDQMQQQLTQQVVELNSRISAWSSSSEEKKYMLNRQSDLVARNVVSPEMRNLADEQYAASLHQKDAEKARLAQKQIQLDGLSKGSFVGEELVGLATLAQKRRDIAFDAERLGIQETELAANIQDEEKLLTAERERLARLAASDVTAPLTGKIFNIGGTSGRHVSAGDSIATLVNCNEAFVVAIFSYRQAQALAVGTPVQILSTGAAARSGTVRAVLPKTSDKSDDQYAIPFPQTERRELYIVVDLADEPATQRAAETSDDTACGVGRWVTVVAANSWLPSTSMMWTAAANAARHVVQSVVGSPAPAATYRAADNHK